MLPISNFGFKEFAQPANISTDGSTDRPRRKVGLLLKQVECCPPSALLLRIRSSNPARVVFSRLSAELNRPGLGSVDVSIESYLRATSTPTSSPTPKATPRDSYGCVRIALSVALAPSTAFSSTR